MMIYQLTLYLMVETISIDYSIKKIIKEKPNECRIYIF